MARTAAGGRNNLTSLETFERLPLFRKRLTWLYYRGEETHNAEGLNGFEVPGSATDYTSSGTVQDYIIKDNFRYWAKKAAKLSKELHEQGSYIEEVDLPSKTKGQPKQEEATEESAEEYDSELQDDYESEATESKQQVSFATMSAKKATASPSSAMKKKAPPRKLSAISGGVGAPIANGIAAPIVKGCFLVRDRKTRKRFNHYHIRMLWHNFIKAEDILYEWIDDRTLKVVVYDPSWWSDPEYQAAFDSQHGKDSNLIDSMIDFQEDRKEQVPGQDVKRTGNTGYFVFGEAMSIKEEDDTVVIPQSISHNGITGIYIVIKVRVAHDDLADEESTPRKAKAGGAAVAVGTG